MKTRRSLFIPIFALFFCIQLSAQNTFPTIDGPLEVCVGDCAVYTLDTTGVPFFIISEWFFDIDGNLQPITGNTFEFCFQEPGFAGLAVVVTDIIFGTSTTNFYTITIDSGASQLEIISDSSCPAVDSTNNSCEKVCAFSTVTYTVPGNPSTEIDWEVTGAVNFTTSGNSVEVEWGEPGSGLVEATVEPQSCDLELYCGGSCNEISNNLCVAFVEASCGTAPYTYQWSDGQTTSILYDVWVGTYSVTVTDANGMSASCFVDLNFNQACDPSITANIVKPSSCSSGVCDGAIYPEVLNGYPGGGVSFFWTGPNGFTSTAQSLVNVCAGTYTLTVEDPTGCPGTRTFVLECDEPTCGGTTSLCVEILEEPEAIFSTSPPITNGVVNICEGQTVYFTNESVNAEHFTWDFGPGQSFNDLNSFYTYTEAGTYTVSLIAANECFCADTTSVTIEVEDAVGPEVDCVGTICEGEVITYTSSDDCGTFTWTVSNNGTITEGGGPNDNFVTISWGDGPLGTIELSVADCTGDYCSEPTIAQIPIISDNAEIEGATRVCNGQTAAYTMPLYSGTEYLWTVSGNGTIESGLNSHEITVQWQSNIVPNTDQYVIVEYDNCYLGCGGRDTLEVGILPEYYLSGPIEACENEATPFSAINAVNENLTVDVNWTVIAPDGSTIFNSMAPAANFNVDWTAGPGTYQVQVVAANFNDYCTDSYVLEVDVVTPPPAVSSIIGATEICPGQFYAYQAISASPNFSFTWQVNDGGNVTERMGNPINVIWGNTPPYELSVTQTSVNGPMCESAALALSVDPIPSFTITETADACRDETAVYTSTAFQDITYSWSVFPPEAGTVVDGQNTLSPEILWHQAGTHDLELNICGVVEIISVVVHDKPEPSVNHPIGLCVGETGSISTTTVYTSYTWYDEGGSIVSTLANPNLGPGYYELVVEDNFGCEEDTTFFIDPYPLPDINISTPDNTWFCPGQPAPDLYAVDTEDGYTYEWFRDGASIGMNMPVINADQYGVYRVEVTDQNGCMAASNSITVQDICCPAGQVCNDSIPGGGTTCFPGTLVSFEIDQPIPICNEHSYTNTSTSFIPGTLSWNFGDPASGAANFSSQENPTHVFGEAGFYTIRLRGLAPDPLNPGQNFLCRDAKIDTVLIAANFDVDNACPGSETQFTDISTFLPISSIASWSWDFGDPASGAANTSSDQHPMHIFSTDGNYDVTLTITEPGGCISVKTQTITVNPRPVVDFPIPTINCQATAMNFVLNGSANITSVSWDFGDPTSNEANTSTLENTYHEYATPGDYTVTLYATNIYGCNHSISKVITVEPNGLTGAIDLSQPSPICEGDQVTLTAPAGGVAWLWSNGEMGNSITVEQSEVYSVTITNADGCEYQPAPVVIDVIPAPDGTIRLVELDDFGQPINYVDDTYEACEGEDINLEIQDVSSYSYLWTGMISGNTLQFTDERGNLLSAGNYQYAVTITDNTTGCTSITQPFEVIIHALPDDFLISASETDPICTNTPTTFSVVAPQAGITYVWNTGEVGTSIMSSEPGEYSAVAVNAFGCEKESNRIRILPGPNINRIPAGCHTRCSPDTLCLPPMPGVVNYQWFFNGVAMPAPNGTMMNPIVTESGTYQLEMTDVDGCVVLSDPLTLDLYDGFGNIIGNVYFDANGNGIIDASDPLLSDIAVILSDGTSNLDTVSTDGSGHYDFNNILSTTYEVFIDTLNLDDSLKVLNNLADLTLVGCDDETTYDFLLGRNCEDSSVPITLSVCQGNSVIFAGTALTPGSITPFNYVSQFGCDSTIIVEVIELPNYNEVESYAACAGDAFNYNGTNIIAGTQQVFNYTTVAGCDSIVTVVVDENPVHQMSETLTACAGTSVNYNGTQILAGTQQSFTYPNQFGCDSTIMVEVISNPISVATQTFDACLGESIVFDGLTIPAGTQEIFHYQNQFGCDSTLTVVVNALPVQVSAETIQACAGTTINYNGVMIPAGSQEVVVYANQYGCDSTITVTVTANPVYQDLLSAEACAGDSFVFDGVAIPAGTQQVFNYQSYLGCDSMITVDVVANPLDQSDLTLQACAGSTVLYNGMTLNAGSQQDIYLSNQYGCDSIVNVVVTSNPLDATVEHLSACVGTSIVYDGVSIAAGGQAAILYSNQFGCDSTVTVIVAADPLDATTTTLSACAGTSIVYDGISIAAGDQVDISYLNQYGCDSIVTVAVLENEVYDQVETLSACAGSSIVYDGVSILAGTQQVFNYQSQSGCDSIITVEVMENASYNAIEELSACIGEAVLFDGVSIAAGTQQVFNYQSQLGCDSVITVTVAANPTFSTVEQIPACVGSSISYQGTSIAAGTQQDFTFTSQLGCDSVVTVIVEAQPLSQTALSLETCLGSTLEYNGQTLAIGDSETFVLTNQYGCDSTVEVSVLPYPDFDFILEANTVCENTFDGEIKVEELVGGTAPFSYAIEQLDFQDSGRFDNLAAGIYTISIQDANGCLHTDEVEVIGRVPLQVQLDEVILDCDQDSILLVPQISGSIEELAFAWPDGSTAPFFYAKSPGDLWVDVSNICESKRAPVTVFLEEEGRTSFFYVPNAFSPNNDGVNDDFKAYPGLSVDIMDYTLQVFDRWGNTVFTSNSINQGWTGFKNSRRINPGVFIWQVQAKIFTCGREINVFESGDVTLLR
ncbi:MAG: PKD domain-containing protein [Bacteroidota bacterium]